MLSKWNDLCCFIKLSVVTQSSEAAVHWKINETRVSEITREMEELNVILTSHYLGREQ